MHLKRHQSPILWPIERKGTKYVVKARSNDKLGIPLIIALREMLKIVQNRKEVKEAISLRKILVNGKPVTDEKKTLVIFDVLAIPSMNKFYKLIISENEKFKLEEISEKESGKKISKIVDKRMIKGKKIQLNLIDGRNYLSQIKCKVNDSVVIDFKKNAIEKCLPFEEKSVGFVFKGKHLGKSGRINKIDEKTKSVEIEDGKNKINALIEQIIITD